MKSAHSRQPTVNSRQLFLYSAFFRRPKAEKNAAALSNRGVSVFFLN